MESVLVFGVLGFVVILVAFAMANRSGGEGDGDYPSRL
jgi:hypothetical protein